MIESLHDTFVKSCLETAEITIPKKKRLSSVPYWNQRVKPKLDKAFFWYTIWKEFARPPEEWVCCYQNQHTESLIIMQLEIFKKIMIGCENNVWLNMGVETELGTCGRKLNR